LLDSLLQERNVVKKIRRIDNDELGMLEDEVVHIASMVKMSSQRT
jgi:hypothetical protein